MEQEPQSDSTPAQPTELDGSAETPKPPIDALPETLGFTETEELGELREEIIEAMKAGSDIKELITHYHLLAEEIISQYQDDGFARAQIGLIVKMGLTYRDGGRNDDFIENLNDAFTYAENMSLADVVAVLKEAINSGS